MTDPQKPSLPWETKVAIGALALLSLQEIHEVCLYCLGGRASGVASFGPVSIALLALTSSVLICLQTRNRLAWWFGLILTGCLGVLILTESWPTIHQSLPWRQDSAPRMARVMVTLYEWLLPIRFKPFELTWIIAKIALLLTVPALLLLGELRERLRPD